MGLKDELRALLDQAAAEMEAQAPPPAPRRRGAQLANTTATSHGITAAAPTMTVFCDDRQRELVSARALAHMLETTPGWQRRCFAAYGWCEACQVAWMAAHP